MEIFLNYLYEKNEIDIENLSIAWLEAYDTVSEIKKLEVFGISKDIKISINNKKKTYTIHKSKDINYSIAIITAINGYTNYTDLEKMIEIYNDIKKNIDTNDTFDFKHDFDMFDGILFIHTR